MSFKSNTKHPLGRREKYLSDTLYMTRGALREIVEFLEEQVPRQSWLKLVSNKRDPLARAKVMLKEHPQHKIEEMRP